jgi:hypothetical protein
MWSPGSLQIPVTSRTTAGVAISLFESTYQSRRFSQTAEKFSHTACWCLKASPDGSEDVRLGRSRAWSLRRGSIINFREQSMLGMKPDLRAARPGMCPCLTNCHIFGSGSGSGLRLQAQRTIALTLGHTNRWCLPSRTLLIFLVTTPNPATQHSNFCQQHSINIQCNSAKRARHCAQPQRRALDPPDPVNSMMILTP